MSKTKNIANRLTMAKRKKILNLFHDKDMNINQIAEEENVTYWQVYRIISGQTKLNGTPRADKGFSRKNLRKEDEEFTPPKWTLEDFKDLDDFQLFLLMSALEDAASSNLEPAEKVKLVKDIEIIQTKITQRQLKGNIRRPDAEVIARIVRRFNPKATDKEIVAIYKEEMEIYLRDRNNG